MIATVEPSPFFTATQICARYDIVRETLWRWRNDRGFPAPLRFGRTDRWERAAVLAWEQKHVHERKGGRDEIGHHRIKKCAHAENRGAPHIELEQQLSTAPPPPSASPGKRNRPITRAGVSDEDRRRDPS